MMNWDWFIYFAVLSVVLWTAGSWNAFKGSQSKACVFTIAGLFVFGTFIGLLWASLERPPLRTMGETRLWYSFFLLFICVNLLKPEIHNKALMPALQSPWFAPHVIIYMFAYAMLGASAIMGIYLLIHDFGNADRCLVG